MAQQNIDFGTFPDDPSADPIRLAFQKAQNNFTELYSGVGTGSGVTSINQVPGPGITVSQPTGNVIISANIACLQVSTSSLSIGRNTNGNPIATITSSSQTLVVDIDPNNVYSNSFAAVGGGLANLNGTLTANSNAQPNITSLGVLTSLSVSGNTNLGNLNLGNLSVSGNIQGNIIKTNNYRFANGVAVNFLSAAGLNTWVQFNQSGTQVGSSEFVFDPATSNLGLSGNLSVTGLSQIFDVSSTGNINATGNIGGNNFNSSTLTTTGNVNFTSSGNVSLGAVGNIKITGGTSKQFLQTNGSGNLAWATPDSIANGTSSVNIPATNGNVYANVGANYFVVNGNTHLNSNLTVTGTSKINDLTSAGNIQSGNLSVTGSATLLDLTVSGLISTTGNIGANNITVTGNSVLSNITGTFTTASGSQPNITTVGILSSLSVSGTSTLASVSATGLNVTNNILANSITSNGNVTVNNTLFANVANISGDVNIKANGNLSVTGNAIFDSTVSADTLSVSGNINSATVTTSGNVLVGADLSVVGNVTANLFYGDGGLLTNVMANGSQTNITALGTLIGLSVAGNANISGTTTTTDLSVTGNTTLNTLTVTGTPSFIDISATGNIIADTTLSSNGNLVVTKDANIQGNLTVTGSSSVANLSSSGTITSANLTVSGNASISGLISGGNLSITGNANIGNINSGNITATGNITGANLESTGNLSVSGTGTLTDLTVTGKSNLGANSNVIITGGTINQFLQTDGAGNLSWQTISSSRIANGTSNVDITTIDGPIVIGANGVASVLTISDTSITSPVDLGFTGNANIGSIQSPGNISAAGDMIGGNLSTAGNISGNNISITNLANIGNLSIQGFISANGDIAGNNLIAIGNLSANNASFAGNVVLSNTFISNLADPTGPQDAATKNYVDSVAQGLDVKQSVDAATTTTLAITSGGTVSYNNGSSGVDANLTTTGSFTLIDSINIATPNTRILVKNEANAAWNGIYEFTSSTVLTRTKDFDQPSEVVSAFVFVEQGVVNNDSGYVCVTNIPVSIGTTDINWTQFSGAGSFQAGTGLTLTGTVFSVNDTQTQVTSVGTLASLSVSGTATVGNVNTAGSISATGNITAGANLFTTNLTASGDVTAVNFTASGLVTASGNINTSVNISATGNLTSGNVSTTDISASGNANITGNIGISGNASISGSVNVSSSVSISGTATIGTNMSVAGNGTINNLNLTSATATGNIYAAYLVGNIVGTIVVPGNTNEVLYNNNGNANASSGFTFDPTTNAAVVAGTLTAANLSTTGTGNLGTLTVTGKSDLGSVSNVTITGGTANYFLRTDGTGSLSWQPLLPTSIVNGTSNVLASAGGNVVTNVAGNTILTIQSDGMNLNGNASFSGNLTAGNVLATTGNFSSIVGTLVSASGSQPNITTVGTLTSLTVNNNITTNLGRFVGNGAGISNVPAANLAGATLSSNVLNSSLTTVGTLTLLNVSNNVSVGGNLSAGDINAGNITTTGNIDATNFNGGNLLGTMYPTAGSGIAGIIFPTNPGGGSGDQAFIRYYAYSGDACVLEVKVVNDSLSPFGPDIIKLNAVGGTIIDNWLTSTGNTYLGNIGNVTITGGLNGQYLRTDGTGNLVWATVSGATAITNGTSNVDIPGISGNVVISTAGVANVVLVSSTGVIITGTLSSTGNADVGNLGTAGLITATGNITGGNLVGTLANGTSNINIVSNANIAITSAGNANIVVVTGTGANITGTLSVSGNANVGNLGTAGAITATGNISTAGFLTVASNINTGNLIATSNISTTDLNVTGVLSSIGNLRVNNLLVNPGVVFNSLSDGYFGRDTTLPFVNANISVYGNVTAQNFYGNIANASQPNITALGTLVDLSVTGNANISNINATKLTVSGNTNLGAIGNVKITGGTVDQYIVTDGAGNLQWKTLAVSSSMISNGNSSISLPEAGGNAIITVGGNANILVVTSTSANILGKLSVSGNANVGNIGANYIVGTLTTAAQPNITSLGILTSISASGNANVGNLNTAGLVTVLGNIRGGNLLSSGLISTTGNGTFGNISTIGLVTATGNGTFDNIFAVTSLSAGGNVTVAGNTFANSELSISGNLSVAGGGLFTGNVTTDTVTGSLANTTLIAGGYQTIFDNTGKATFPGYIVQGYGTVAATGSTQGTAASITYPVITVTGATAGANSAVLPTGVAGMMITVINTSATSLLLFPASGGQINTLGTNTAYTHAGSTTVMYIATSTTQWYTK